MNVYELLSLKVIPEEISKSFMSKEKQRLFIRRTRMKLSLFLHKAG